MFNRRFWGCFWKKLRNLRVHFIFSASFYASKCPYRNAGRQFTRSLLTTINSDEWRLLECAVCRGGSLIKIRLYGRCIDRLRMSRLVLAVVLLYHFVLIASQESFEFQRIEDCQLTQFFSTTTFQCTDCGKLQVHSDDGELSLSPHDPPIERCLITLLHYEGWLFRYKLGLKE